MLISNVRGQFYRNYADKSWSNEASCILVHLQSPMRRMIDVGINPQRLAYQGRSGMPKGKYFLSFPHILFKVNYIEKKCGKITTYVPSSLRVAFATIKGKKISKICYPALPNINDFKVCIAFPKKEFNSIEDMTKSVINTFWTTKFNNDIVIDWFRYSPRSIMFDYEKWQDKTKNNPDWFPKKSLKSKRISLKTFSKR